MLMSGETTIEGRVDVQSGIVVVKNRFVGATKLLLIPIEMQHACKFDAAL